jgi:hypothetical protein
VEVTQSLVYGNFSLPSHLIDIVAKFSLHLNHVMSCILESGLGVCWLHCKSYYSDNSGGDVCISLLNGHIRTVIY